MMDHNHYTYSVTWSGEDGEYVGLCTGFPSLSWLAPTSDAAFAGIRRLVSDTLTDMQDTGEPAPQPVSDQTLARQWGTGAPGPESRKSPNPANPDSDNSP